MAERKTKRLYTYLCFDELGNQDICFQYIADTEEEAYEMFVEETYDREIGLEINDILDVEITEEEEEKC